MNTQPDALGLELDQAEAELRRGELSAGRDRLTALQPALEQTGDPALRRRGVNMLGAAWFELGELESAERCFGEVLDLGHRSGDALAMARASNNLGLIANIRGAHDAALAHYQLAIPGYERLGHVTGLAETCHNMAITWRDRGHLDEADRHERRAIAWAREAGNSRLIAMTQMGRAELALRRGEPAVAEAGARLGAEAYASVPDFVGEADAWRLIGAANLELGRLTEAGPALDRAVELATRQGARLLRAEALRSRAELRLRLGLHTTARQDAEEAMMLFEGLGAESEREQVTRWLAAEMPSQA